MDKAGAVVRVALGLAQVMGATVALYLLVQTGINGLTMGTTAVTLFCTVLSRLCCSEADRKR